MKDEFLEHLLGIIKSKKGENPEKSYTAMQIGRASCRERV